MISYLACSSARALSLKIRSRVRGSGALIASGREPRIRAVAAMSGWTDLVESLYGNNTRHPQAAWLRPVRSDIKRRP